MPRGAHSFSVASHREDPTSDLRRVAGNGREPRAGHTLSRPLLALRKAGPAPSRRSQEMPYPAGHRGLSRAPLPHRRCPPLVEEAGLASRGSPARAGGRGAQPLALAPQRRTPASPLGPARERLVPRGAQAKLRAAPLRGARLPSRCPPSPSKKRNFEGRLRQLHDQLLEGPRRGRTSSTSKERPSPRPRSRRASRGPWPSSMRSGPPRRPGSRR